MTVRVIDTQDSSISLEEAARQAAETLARGELVLVPTETVYGMAARPSIPAASARLAKLRGGALGPLTPHVPDAAAASAYLGELSPMGRRLMAKLWPGPVALSFDVAEPRRREIALALGVNEGLLFTDKGQIVIRCPDEPVIAAVLRVSEEAIVVSRAGLGGGDANRAPPADSVPEQVSLILDAGPTRFTRPSTVVHVQGNGWTIVREGVFDRRIIERMLHTTVLFVCSGNTCRSPMAAALARKVIAEHIGVGQAAIADHGYEVASAGTFAMPGMQATPQAADAVLDLGGDLSTHRSQPLTVELINRADLILTMGRSHTEGVLALVPSAAGRTHRLDADNDVEDPIGSDAEYYRQLAGRMEQMIRRRLLETVLNAG